MCIISLIALILIIVGAINWGFIGFFDYNFIHALFGGTMVGDSAMMSGPTMWERVIYAVVGLAGIWAISFFCKYRSCCKSGCCKDKCSSSKKDR